MVDREAREYAQLKIRCREDLRRRIEECAEKNGNSINSEMVERLERSLRDEWKTEVEARLIGSRDAPELAKSLTSVVVLAQEAAEVAWPLNKEARQYVARAAAIHILNHLLGQPPADACGNAKAEDMEALAADVKERWVDRTGIAMESLPSLKSAKQKVLEALTDQSLEARIRRLEEMNIEPRISDKRP